MYCTTLHSPRETGSGSPAVCQAVDTPALEQQQAMLVVVNLLEARNKGT